MDDWKPFHGHRKGHTDKRGYVIVYCPEHPNAKSGKHMYLHRLVTENHLRRFLKTTEHVHHKNGNPSDNRISNLEVMENGQHSKAHRRKESPERRKQRIDQIVAVAKRRRKPRVMVACECGCGTMIQTPDRTGHDKRFLNGHQWRARRHAT